MKRSFRMAAIFATLGTLGGCIVAPAPYYAPSYGYAYPPAYAYPPGYAYAPVYPAPAFGLGFETCFGCGHRHRW